MKGRHVVVTGGRGALGKGVVAVLEKRGAIVHVTPDPPALHLEDEAQAVAYFAGLPSPLWASIHLVGGFAMKPIVETSLADFEAQWRVNVATCFLACREAVRAFRKAGGAGGRIVNVGARAVLTASPGMSSYVTAKAGVVALTQALAAEVLADNILVNAVLPSIIDTPANRASMPKADFATWPKPTEIAEAIAFLVSPENTLTSGTAVPVYGRG
jgi:NAD(P)-dependent dehydrogenase (short-subunit alcohol dehydrogenase family)